MKAWAVVDRLGVIVWELRDSCVFRTRAEARRHCMKSHGERVVRVTVRIEE